MSDNRPEEEIAELFANVLNDAYQADVEETERWSEAFGENIAAHLDNGDVVIDVYNHPKTGEKYVAVPADIMVELLKTLNEFSEFNNMIAYQAEIGNAAILLEPLMDDVQAKSVTVKSAFIMMALVKDSEKQTNDVVKDIVRDILGADWIG